MTSSQNLWLYRESKDGMAVRQFIVLVNGRSSSSCRILNGETGRLEQTLPARGVPYTVAFDRMIRSSHAIFGLPHIKMMDIDRNRGVPIDSVNQLRSQVGLQPIREPHKIAKYVRTSGILDGIED